MALYIMQTLIAAVDDLVALESESLEGLLARLQKEEDDHYAQASRRNPLDDEIREHFKDRLGYKFEDLQNVPPDLDLYSLFLTGKSICHTVRLPSQIRYLGFLTDSTKTGGPSVYGKETFDMGLELQEAKAMSNTEATNSLQLVWEANLGQRKHQCPLLIAPDPKDSFFTQHGDGWREFVIPNRSTREVYRYDPSAMKGVVIMVLHPCDWDQCPEGMLQGKDLEEKWDMKINDVPVTNLTDIGNYAILAQNANGITFPQGSNGGYKLEFHVNKPEYYAKISSIIVF